MKKNNSIQKTFKNRFADNLKLNNGLHILSSTLVILFIGLNMLSCSHKMNVVELDSTTDPQVELERLSISLTSARDQQIDVLAPENFKMAISSRDEALKLRSLNEPQKKVLYQIALSQAYLKKSREVYATSSLILEDVIVSRQQALEAGSQKIFPKEMINLDQNLLRITKKIEGNEKVSLDKSKASMLADYQNLELRTIKQDKLGTSRTLIDKAKSEGAKKLTPETLLWAEKIYSENEKRIEIDRHDFFNVNLASKNASDASIRLMRMVRTAKNSKQKNPEQLAKWAEANSIDSEESNNELQRMSSRLAQTEDQLENSDQQVDELKFDAQNQLKFEKALSQFTKDEADVYKQGKKLVLRLKGLTFANNKSTIDSKNYALLAKVQKVLSDFNESTHDNQILIEGHTDSTGQKKLNQELSLQRANSVLRYLVSNDNSEPKNIKADGLGDTKPISSNKTSAGRSQNRRVDVIIDTTIF